MPNANAMAGASRLKHAIHALKDCWLRVEPDWTDATRRRFEERYVAPLDPAVDAALIGLQKLSEVLDRVRRDCSDRSEMP